MKNLQQEYDSELEQQRLKASSGASGRTSRDGSPLGRADRQAAFASELEAAAAAAKGSGNGGGAAVEEQEEQLPQFAAMLGAFLAGAQQRQEELDAVSADTSALVRATVAWLGETASDQNAASVFELLFSFTAGFDHCCKRLLRHVAAADGGGVAARPW